MICVRQSSCRILGLISPRNLLRHFLDSKLLFNRSMPHTRGFDSHMKQVKTEAP